MDVLIFGDSHTGALRRGQIAIETDGLWPDEVQLTVKPFGGGHLACEPFFTDRGDHAEITLPEYRRQFDRLPRDEDSAATIYGVSALLHPVRVWRNPAWREFRPADMVTPDTASSDATPASSGMIRRLAIEDQRHMLALVELLKRAGRRLFAIEAPRPFRHHPALRKTPAEVVIRVDSLYRDVIREELRRLGVPIVAVPERCLDEDGFTCEHLGQVNDPHHGNEAFGAIMMGEVLAHLRQGSAANPAIAPARDREG